MNNAGLARIFYDIADILELQEVAFKPAAYRKAARSIETLPKEAAELYAQGGIKALREIPGVGEAIAAKIEELLKTGRLIAYDELRKKMPGHLEELNKVQSLGPKRIKLIHEKLGVSTVAELEKAAKEHKISALPGFGKKSEDDILKGIELVKRGQERWLLGVAYPLAHAIETDLKAQTFVQDAVVAGSLRRMKETIGDFDILCASRAPEKVMDFFTRMPLVTRVLAKGRSKSMVILENGLQADLRVVANREFGSALQYFTGSKEHSVALREIAVKKGLKISEYGVFERKTNRKIAGRTEEELYRSIGMDYIEPELRENTGELDAAQKHQLPKLITYDAIRGDMQMHTTYSDGSHSIEEMARAAQSMNYQYICITDHSVSQRIAHGMDESKLDQYIADVRSVDRKMPGIRVFAGIEADILNDGTVDYGSKVLEKFDVVIASVHSSFKMDAKEMTDRILRAISHNHVDCIGHPTGRLINERNPYQVDLDKIFAAAKANRVMMEVSAYPSRLDLNDANARNAVQAGVKLLINTDSHSTDHLRFMFYGIATARRGWVEAKDVVNTLPLKALPKYFKNLKL